MSGTGQTRQNPGGQNPGGALPGRPDRTQGAGAEPALSRRHKAGSESAGSFGHGVLDHAQTRLTVQYPTMAGGPLDTRFISGELLTAYWRAFKLRVVVRPCRRRASGHRHCPGREP